MDDVVTMSEMVCQNNALSEDLPNGITAPEGTDR